MRAGLDSSPHYGGKDVTGTQVTKYENMGRVYAIAEKGNKDKRSLRFTFYARLCS